MRQDGYPLLRQRRVSGLGEACIPLEVPRIEPMMDVMRGEENVKGCVVGVQRQLREEKWQMHGRSHQQYEADWDGPLPSSDRFSSLQGPLFIKLEPTAEEARLLHLELVARDHFLPA